MNSALQGLAHTRPLTEYFVNDEHVYDVNTTSRMGYGGEIAVLYGELVKVRGFHHVRAACCLSHAPCHVTTRHCQSMWSASAGAVAPRRLKQIIGKWNEQFAGLDQQDSQELLAFLLNGLNEDLNRVSTKPYADQPDRYARLPCCCCRCCRANRGASVPCSHVTVTLCLAATGGLTTRWQRSGG